MHRRTIVIVMICVLVIAAAIAIQQWTSLGESTGITGHSDARSPGPRSPVQNPIASDRGFALPASGSAIRRYYPALAGAAASGSATAACRLAADLQRCSSDDKNLEIVEGMASFPGGAMRPEVLDSMVKQVEKSASICEGVSSTMLQRAFDFQLTAAQRSERYARWVAANPALDKQNFLRDLAGWRRYESFASRYFTKALKERRTEDLGLLLLVHAPSSYSFARPPYRVEDPAMFVALYRLATQSGVEVPPHLHMAARRETSNNNAGFEARVATAVNQLGSWSAMTSPDQTLTQFLPQDGAAFCK